MAGRYRPLAERAGMWRSTFALKFKETVGASPMEYLTRWRMLLAGDKLVNSSDSLSVIALSLVLQIRKRLQHSLQVGHGLLAAAIQMWAAKTSGEDTRANQLEAAGWPGPEGFLAVLMMKAAGVHAAEMARRFIDAARRIQ
jgi:hypothetical protein